jgi:adenylate cyclase
LQAEAKGGGGRGRLPIAFRTRLALAVSAIGQNVLGGVILGVLIFWALPSGAELTERHVVGLNASVAVAYIVVSIPLGMFWARRWTSVPAGADGATLRRTMLDVPFHLAVIHGAMWIAAAVILVLINISSPRLAITLGVSILTGAFATSAMTYWLSERVLRSEVATILTSWPPTTARGPRLRVRALAAWLLGTGIPLLMLLLVAAGSLVVGYSTARLAAVVLVFGGLAVLSGLAVTAITGAGVADPIDEIRRGMRHVEHGDYEITVPVFDASELGLLQAGFNKMVAGLRERERLRDLFGRHVGRDVAQMALQHAPDDDSQNDMGGGHCEVSVLFVDLVGSSKLAADLPPAEVVAILNDFFATVVEVVERNGGWVNKFEGDAALAVFGAPAALPDSASSVLCTARELATEMRRFGPEIRAGIGVSAGQAVAGYIGERQRYEYTVIGDPVNEAARLSEVAKQCGGVAASGRALTGATKSEAARWRIIESRTLRGRETPTDIAVPR